MSNVRTITHHVHFILVYTNPRRAPSAGFLECTSEDQARFLARDMRAFTPPDADNAHEFKSVHVVQVSA